MYKLLFFLFTIVLFSCAEKKTIETTIPAADTLMDSTIIKMKADTTAKMLDNLEDSLNKLRERAADKAKDDNWLLPAVF